MAAKIAEIALNSYFLCTDNPTDRRTTEQLVLTSFNNVLFIKGKFRKNRTFSALSQREHLALRCQCLKLWSSSENLENEIVNEW